MTKKQLNAFITKTLAEAGYGRGYMKRVNVYANWEDREQADYHLWEDCDLSEYRPHVEPTHVITVKVFRRISQPGWEADYTAIDWIDMDLKELTHDHDGIKRR